MVNLIEYSIKHYYLIQPCPCLSILESSLCVQPEYNEPGKPTVASANKFLF
jgi:hypothetical protein